MPSLGSAVLEVLIRLVYLAFSPALTADKLHFQVEGAPPTCSCSQSSYPNTYWTHTTCPEPISTWSTNTNSNPSEASRRYAAARMGDVDRLKYTEYRLHLEIINAFPHRML